MQSFAGNIFFVGAGNMGGAILCALAEKNNAESIFFYEPNEEQAKKIEEKSKAKKISSIQEGFSKADIVFLCVKPQVFAEIRKGEKFFAPTIVSIMAGIPISALNTAFPKSAIVRTMPNIAVVAKKGTVAIATDGVPEATLQIIENLFSACASTVRVLESQMDAVTGLSGSGPAFAFQFIEAMAMGGVKMGLQRDIAIKLAISTVCGSAEMLKQTALNPGELTANVCSPAGTTIAGLQELETRAFKGTVMAAVEAATKRSAELGKS
jgi:pyrroline-5-carboxylate reductase